jgi:hypothetical protein
MTKTTSKFTIIHRNIYGDVSECSFEQKEEIGIDDIYGMLDNMLVGVGFIVKEPITHTTD